MINLDIDFSYLNRYYNIGSDAFKLYQNKSITEIMQIEAANGNEQAAQFMLKISSDPNELAKVFQLANPRNRFLILMNMNTEDLMKVMQCLNPKELILGLSIFNQEVLIELMKNLPQETLSKLVLKNMDEDTFLKMLPEDYMDEFLSSDKINRDMFANAFEGVEEEQLQKMMEKMTGQPCYDKKENILQQVNSFNDDQFKGAVFSLEKEGKQQIIGGLLKEKPELFKEFSPDAMVFPFQKMKKEDVLNCLSVLKTDELLPMVEELPQDVMALIATQISPEDFSKILSTDFKDIIASLGVK